jgi:flagellar biosynthesis protein FlhB
VAQDPERTEKATPKRRDKLRQEGTVLRAPDLDAAVMLWANLFLFVAAWSATFTLMAQQVAYFLKATAAAGQFSTADLQSLALNIFFIVLKILLPFYAVNFLVALANQFRQHGFKPHFGLLAPKFEKLNPVPGFRRIVSPKAVVEIFKSLAKFFILGWVAYLVLAPRIPVLLTTLKLPLGQSLHYLQSTLFIMYRNVMIAMLVLALIDFFYQRHAFEKGMRMTKQEVKDEAKDAEGNPEIKRFQKQQMFQSLLRRIIAQVPKASVVITNPTHFAVALRYDEKTAAPVCVAKGVDHLALKIRERAAVSGVTIVENPPLARSLYRSVELDRPIPPELYQAVAQVLAYVYRMKGAA